MHGFALDSAKSSTMRVAFLTNYIPLHLLDYHREVASALRSRIGTDNEWVCRFFLSSPMERNRQWDADWRELDVVVQVSLSVRERSSHPSGFSDGGQLFIPLSTLRDLVRLAPHLVISAEMGTRSVFAAWYCQRHRIPLVIWSRLSQRSEEARGWVRRNLRRWLVRRAALVITHGQSAAGYVRALGVPDSKIAFAPYACGGGQFSNIPLERSSVAARRWLILGQLIERKGVIVLLEALARLFNRADGRTLEVWIAGTGPLEQRLRSMILPESIRVCFLGNVPYERLPEIMAECGVLAYPTLADEWGMVVNEAMAGGLIVAGSIYSQAVLEMVERGVNGFRFDPLDFGSIKALSIDLSAVDDAALAHLRSGARATAMRWSPAWTADRFATAIASLPAIHSVHPS